MAEHPPTFLFADLVGFTALTTRRGDRDAADVAVGFTEAVRSAAAAVLDVLDASAVAAMAPTVLASQIVSRIDAQHAFLINRNKVGSMALAGETLFVLEMQPASYAILATNEAEKAADIKVVDYRMIGATGRVYLTGREGDVRAAAEAAEQSLQVSV